MKRDAYTIRHSWVKAMSRKIAEMWPEKISRKELKKKMDRGDKFILVDHETPIPTRTSTSKELSPYL